VFILQDVFLTSSELDRAVEHKNLHQANSILGDKDDERRKVMVGRVKLLILACCTSVIPKKQC